MTVVREEEKLTSFACPAAATYHSNIVSKRLASSTGYVMDDGLVPVGNKFLKVITCRAGIALSPWSVSRDGAIPNVPSRSNTIYLDRAAALSHLTYHSTTSQQVLCAWGSVIVMNTFRTLAEKLTGRGSDIHHSASHFQLDAMWF